MTVASGSATASQNGSQLSVTTSQIALLNWQSFNIAAGETTIFNQPSAAPSWWNRINDANPSQIYGSLQANGMVVLMNSSGFYFGPNSFVQTGRPDCFHRAIASRRKTPAARGNSTARRRRRASSITGKSTSAHGGSAFLIAENVVNFGDINAPGGTIGIAAGQEVLVSERPDGRGLSMKVTLPAGSVDNDGRHLRRRRNDFRERASREPKRLHPGQLRARTKRRHRTGRLRPIEPRRELPNHRARRRFGRPAVPAAA